MRIANRDSRDFVMNLKPFKGSNLHAENKGNLYVVYSYGWWPLWIYCKENKIWIENTDKYSVSTSKHKTQSSPLVKETVKLNRLGIYAGFII